MSNRYSYKALDAKGNSVDGFLDAEKQEDVGTWLSDRGYLVIDIAQAPLQNFVRPNRNLKISNKDMNFFLIQLANLIGAGCPLLMSLNALYNQVRDYSLKILLKDVKEKIECGKSLSEALKTHKEVFSSLFITMVEVGEVGGMLDGVLKRYSEFYDKSFRLKKKIQQAMIYPSILMFGTIVVAWTLLVKVFPVFIEGTKRNGSDLPGITQFVLNISNLLSDYYGWIILVVTASVMLYKAVKRNAKGNRFITSVYLNIPKINDVIKNIQISLFANTLGTLLHCGVPILTSLQAVEKVLSNIIYKECVTAIREAVSRGESLSQSLGKHRELFPESLILMADVGERSGNMGEMLERAGNIYEKDMESALETAVTFIQPALVVFIAVFIVTIAMAMYMPLFDIAKTVG